MQLIFKNKWRVLDAATKLLLPVAAVPCSLCQWSGNVIQRRWIPRSSAADCSCSAWQEEPAGPTSEGQSCTCLQLTVLKMTRS